MRVLTFFIIFSVLFSCKDESEKIDVFEEETNKKNIPIGFAESNIRIKEKKIKQFKFKAKLLNAITYLEKNNKRIDNEDLLDLSKESVMILEIETLNQFQDIFNHKKNNFNKDDLIKYLINDINNDIWIKQSKNILRPNASIFENSRYKKNLIRVTFFFKGLNLAEKYDITLYDRIFGEGLIKFVFNNNLV